MFHLTSSRLGPGILSRTSGNVVASCDRLLQPRLAASLLSVVRCISQGHGGLHERVAREPSVSLFAARLITSGKGEQYQSEGRIRPALPRTSNTNTKTLPSRLRIPLFVQTLGGRSGTSVPLPDVKPPETGLRSLTKTFAPGPFDQIQQCSSGSNFSPAI